MAARSTRPTVRVAALLAALALAVGGLAPAASAGKYSPSAGVTTNNPRGDRAHSRAIIRKLIRTIDSTPRHQIIQVASWNVRSDGFVDALIRAHRRHVTVRLILSRGNANPDNPNAGIRRLRRALSQHNRGRAPAARSHVRTCRDACRGGSGFAHSKFFLFSRSGKARDVVINGSANATDLAASNQWNDVYTVTGQPGVYDEFVEVFRQMYRGKPVAQGYRAMDFGRLTTMFYPYRGRHTRTDPVLRELNRTGCSGARNASHGHTRIRIAMTSWFGGRGLKIGRRVRQMQNRGCDVRIIYAVMGNQVLRVLRRGGPRPVPMRQIVVDVNDDAVYDSYLHMKVMTIRGSYAGDPRAWITINGSANWSPAVLRSDEAVLRIESEKVVRRYDRWIGYLFAHPPDRHPNSRASDAEVRRTHPDADPYAKIQPD